MDLKYLLETYDIMDIANHMQETYPDQEFDCYLGYIDVMEQLKETEHIPNTMVIHIDYAEKDWDGKAVEEPYWAFYGIEFDSGDRWALDFMSWGKWLKCEMAPECSKLADLDLICHCLWEMTFYGWKEADIKEVTDDLDSRVENVKAGKEKSVVFDNIEDTGNYFKKLVEEAKKEKEKQKG